MKTWDHQASMDTDIANGQFQANQQVSSIFTTREGKSSFVVSIPNSTAQDFPRRHNVQCLKWKKRVVGTYSLGRCEKVKGGRNIPAHSSRNTAGLAWNPTQKNTGGLRHCRSRISLRQSPATNSGGQREQSACFPTVSTSLSCSLGHHLIINPSPPPNKPNIETSNIPAKRINHGPPNHHRNQPVSTPDQECEQPPGNNSSPPHVLRWTRDMTSKHQCNTPLLH